MKVERLEGLTDAVVAIAATIMVLELEIPEKVSFASLFEQWPVFFAHFVSFFVIYILWFNHYREFSKLKTVSPKVALLNGLWLSFLTLIPFATNWVGRNINKTIPQLFYSSILFICALLYQWMFFEIGKEHPELDMSLTTSFKNRLPVYIGYIISIIFAFVKPVLSLVTIPIVVIITVIQILKISKRTIKKA